jgi:hypothetical protein
LSRTFIQRGLAPRRELSYDSSAAKDFSQTKGRHVGREVVRTGADEATKRYMVDFVITGPRGWKSVSRFLKRSYTCVTVVEMNLQRSEGDTKD